MAELHLNPEKLEQQIRNYNRAYRKGEPQISDAEFDDLVGLLKELNPDANWFKKGVQDEVESRKEKLPIPMYSLEKVKTYNEIIQWIQSCNLKSTDKLIITPKYDGISLCVDETIGKAWTRGDGEYGQTCDDKFCKMDSNWSPEDESVALSFGEAIIPTPAFLNLKNTEQYKSARNTVAGLINSSTVSPNLRYVSYIRYGCDRDDWDKQKQLEFLQNADEWNEVSFTSITVGNLTQNEESFVTLMNRLFETLTANFKCDGLVIDVNDAEMRNRLGRLANNNPKYAIAYKNPDWAEREETLVTKIDWQVSKDGRLAPVVNVEPVELCGATVSRCTAYNARYIRENSLTPGTRIVIARSGDVIPKHLKTVKVSKNQGEILPSKCPICGNPLKYDGVDLICSNSSCDGILLSKCVYFFSILGFEEFREPTIKKLFNAGYKYPYSIYNLTEEELQNIEGIGNVAAKVLSNQFEMLRKKGTNFAKFLTAANYFNGVIAEKTCQKILNEMKFMTVQDVIDFCTESESKYGIVELTGIDGVGETTAVAFKSGLKKWYQEKCESNTYNLPITFYGLEEKSFEGQMTVVFTGFRNKEWESYLTNQGHKIGSSVSKKTTCLVVKEKGSGSTKEQKAESLGIPIFTMQEFKEKFIKG